MQFIYLAGLGFLCMYLLQGRIQSMLADAGQVVKNYQGKEIPSIMGISLIFSVVVVATIWLALQGGRDSTFIYIVFGCAFMGLVGTIDDVIGNHQSKGFKGHILYFLKGKVTTGVLKMLAAAVVAGSMSILISNSMIEILINFLLISLVTNFINLLDTRPGRAMKGFLLITILSILTRQFLNVHAIVVGAVLAYWPIDLSAKGMLGDTGANFLGIVLGISLAMQNNMWMKGIYVLIFLLLNLASEKVSFSKVIEQNAALRFLDDIGRR